MAASNAVHSYGATLTRNGNTIAEVKSISGPKVSLSTVDVTHLNSDNKYREYIGGLLDSGEVTFDCNFYPGDSNGQAYLYTDMEARTLQTFVLTLPTAMATTYTFTALVTGIDLDIPEDDKVGISVTLKISGKATRGITASTGMSALAGIEDNSSAALSEVPSFAIGTFEYSCTVNTASTWVKLTPTAASHTITITDNYDSSEQTVASGAQSGELALDSADSVTQIDVKVQESGKTAKTYTLYVVRP